MSPVSWMQLLCILTGICLCLFVTVSNLISVYISKEKGEEIAHLVDNGTRVTLHVQIATNHFRFTNINKTSVLFVSVSFAILMIISLAWLIFYYVQRFRYIHAKDIMARRLCNAAKKALEKIPTKTLRASDVQQQQLAEFAECCAVCIELFKVFDLVRILPCRHTFHKTCVDPWLLEQRSCPMCKLDILKHYGLGFEVIRQENIFSIGDVTSGAPHVPSRHNGFNRTRTSRTNSIPNSTGRSPARSARLSSSGLSITSNGGHSSRVAPSPSPVITSVAIVNHHASSSPRASRTSSVLGPNDAISFNETSLPGTCVRNSGECTPTEINISVQNLQQSLHQEK